MAEALRANKSPLPLSPEAAVLVDKAAAAEWFRKAADHGHTRAQSCLGDALFYGDGVPINKTAAAAWYREAAEEGHGDAQYKIGLAYFSGDGVKVDQGALKPYYTPLKPY